MHVAVSEISRSGSTVLDSKTRSAAHARGNADLAAGRVRLRNQRTCTAPWGDERRACSGNHGGSR